jgi:hypothetical protein
MIWSMLTKLRAAFWRGAQQALVLSGAVLVTLTLSAIVLPFLLGLALLAAAQWAAQRTEDNQERMAVPIVVG